MKALTIVIKISKQILTSFYFIPQFSYCADIELSVLMEVMEVMEWLVVITGGVDNVYGSDLCDGGV